MNRSAFVLSTASALFASSLFATSASAQLVVGTHTTTTGAGAAYFINLDTLDATRLWTQTNNHRVNGIAADETGHRLYTNDSARLSTWDYGSIGTVPTFVSANGGLFRTNGTTNTATGVDGLEFVNGTLYGWTNFASSTYSDGIYSISTSGSTAGLMTPFWLNNGVYDFEGLAYNPTDGKFYGTNTKGNAGQPVGLYSIDAFRDSNAVPQLVTAFDSTLGLSAYDGLAIGGGAAYLTQYVNGTLADNSDDLLVISKYDFTTGTFVDSFGLAIPSSSQVATGAAWAPGALTAAPEPASLSLLAAAGGLMIRRRRK